MGSNCLQLSRRQGLSLTFLLWLAHFGYAFAQPEELKIVHITDPHVCNLSAYHPALAEARRHYGNGAPKLRNFLERLPLQLKAGAVVITGDLVDYFEAETPSGEMLGTQIEQFTFLFADSQVPLLLTLGNHDIASYWIQEEDSSKQSSQVNATAARAAWIRNFPCFRLGTYYSRDFRMGRTRFRLIFLDNAYSFSSEEKILDEVQMDWLVQEVREVGDDPVVLFLHKYLPVGDKNGDGVFFGRNPLDWPDAESCAKGFLKTLRENDNIQAMIVGHGHKNVIETIDFPGGHKLVQCETGAFAQDPGNWRLLRFAADGIGISTPGGGDTEAWITLEH